MEYGGMDRKMFNRLTAEDVVTYYRSVMHAFASLHEMQRPVGAPSLRLVKGFHHAVPHTPAHHSKDKQDRHHSWRDFHFDRYPGYGGRKQCVTLTFNLSTHKSD
jgi:hypothetical protein